MSKITCRGVDISEHIGAMFDALVGSMDWGSGLLTDDQIDAIMTVGALAGWDLSKASPKDSALESCPLCIETWRKQFVAKANALAKGDE